MAGVGRKKGDGKGRYGGRKKGTPNKVTQEMKEVLSPILSAYMGGGIVSKSGKRMSLADDLEDMEPSDRGRLMKDLLTYVAPKMASMEVKAEVKQLSFLDELDELSQET